MSDFLQKLNPQQQQAVIAIDGAVMVLAGAGSGKTRVLTNRIVYMVNEKGINPDNILAITFTNKAAAEMKSRLLNMLENIGKMLISTIHSMCTRILRFEVENLNHYTSNFTIYSESDCDKVIKNLFKLITLSEDEKKINFLYHIGAAKNEALSNEEYFEKYLKHESNGEVIFKIMNMYNKALKNSNAMDFDDLLYNVYILFKTKPEILAKYQKRFKYICIDEFQDVNHVQYLIFKLLANRYKNIFIVGDDDQSIYGWRGADSHNLLNFKNDFPDATIIKLEENYRSTKSILNVANAVIEKNTDRYGKKLWTNNDSGVNVELYEAQSENDEAFYVISKIENLKRYSGIDYKDCAILMRVNALSRTFEQELIKYGIGYKIYGGFKFFERKEIKDILAYLRLIDNNKDNEALLRIINFPKRGIGESTLNKLIVYAEEEHLSYLEAACSCENITGIKNTSRLKLREFASLIVNFTEKAKSMPLMDFVIDLTETLSLRKNYNEEAKYDNSHELYLDEFLESVEEFEKNNNYCKLNEYLQSVSLQSDLDGDSSGNEVTLATIHSAKGLEFKAVFIVGLETGIFPLARSYFNLSEMAEERRLMYVAITRAMERLYITRASSRFLYGQRKDQGESVFYNEIKNYINPFQSKIKSSETHFKIHDEIKDNSNVLNNYQAQKKENNIINQYKPGMKIVHKVFGIGTIITQKNDTIDVAFNGIGVKTLAIKYAPISLYEE